MENKSKKEQQKLNYTRTKNANTEAFVRSTSTRTKYCIRRCSLTECRMTMRCTRSHHLSIFVLAAGWQLMCGLFRYGTGHSLMCAPKQHHSSDDDEEKKSLKCKSTTPCHIMARSFVGFLCSVLAPRTDVLNLLTRYVCVWGMTLLVSHHTQPRSNTKNISNRNKCDLVLVFIVFFRSLGSLGSLARSCRKLHVHVSKRTRIQFILTRRKSQVFGILVACGWAAAMDRHNARPSARSMCAASSASRALFSYLFCAHILSKQ